MSWAKLLKRANSYAQANAQATFDAHADPKIQLEQAISGLQEHHRDLEAAATQVIAQEKTAKMRLADLSQDEARYTKSALSAKQQGNLDVARTFATKIAGLREQIQALTAQIPQLEQAAGDAREAVQESADQLQAKMNEQSGILAQIDQARMQQEMAANLKQVSDLTRSSDVPSFDEIKQKVAGQFAQAQASTELSSTSPEVLEMHAHHAELTSEADDILAQLDAGTLQPAALSAAPPAPGSSAPPQ
ncbi:MAG: PspA/IM30 family protein [Acidimicrobiales bacterium]